VALNTKEMRLWEVVSKRLTEHDLNFEVIVMEAVVTIFWGEGWEQKYQLGT
jgi:hypothetical protein